ncbi:MAG: septal ring lytic transglycosylase RlpA family protein [Gammaproteobacteria bacterium]|nr:septal ring lytic transglycosylase RlpA family protein [Gammaproteobacteria bacterium]MBT8151831.1 septal ring lytic transglycosylase RlpA family protein [Gammaproteobacteria bacterium]NND39196.1 septal ring lytic transglycosylase RlpA family protein [Pseudomonadales bacterium]NNM11698.1 septal ring lytic transglycosylase RlpA family protein [Pseudomonadales bacterium]RZV51423.1 MAG: septal ring lytic transglycosylase RlpA family protein [Pseudomonadales bacterium]
MPGPPRWLSFIVRLTILRSQGANLLKPGYLQSTTLLGRTARWSRGLALCAVLVLAGCSFFSGLKHPVAERDRAPRVKLDEKRIADAEPRVEPRSRGGNRSVYTVFGKSYRVLDDAQGFRERGPASWYGKKFHGRLTANGERYDMYQMTAAHKHLPLPSYVRVKNMENGREIIVRVNDRGPFHGDRIIDLSYAAATKLGMLRKGTAKVEIEVIDAKAWQQAKRQKQRAPAFAAAPSIAKAANLGNVAKAPSTSVANSAVKPLPQPAIPRPAPPSGKTMLADGARHYVQVAAFSQLAAAQGVQNTLLERLNAGELPAASANVVIHPADEAALYRVRIGPLASRQQVDALIAHPSLASYMPMHGVSE